MARVLTGERLEKFRVSTLTIADAAIMLRPDTQPRVRSRVGVIPLFSVLVLVPVAAETLGERQRVSGEIPREIAPEIPPHIVRRFFLRTWSVTEIQNMTEMIASALSGILLSDTFAVVQPQKITTTIEVGRPNAKSWFASHPTDVAKPVAIINMPTERGSGIYVVRADMVPHVPQGDMQFVALHRSIDIGGSEFLLPVRLQGDDGWATSLREAVRLSTGGWIRLTSDRANGRYSTATPVSTLPAPVWSEKSLDQLVGIAIKDRLIDNVNHPILKVLRGEQ